MDAKGDKQVNTQSDNFNSKGNAKETPTVTFKVTLKNKLNSTLK